MSITIPELNKLTTDEMLMLALDLNDPMTGTAAQRGLSILIGHTPITGTDSGEEALVSVLTDLMHWCRENRVSFQNCLTEAANTYEEELTRRAADDDITVY